MDPIMVLAVAPELLRYWNKGKYEKGIRAVQTLCAALPYYWTEEIRRGRK